jgi:hypothetical protein
LPTDAGAEPEPKRDLRDRPLVRVAMIVGILLIAVVAAKTCASRDTEVTSEEATEIAREVVDFEPDQVMVRFIPQGAQSRPFWAVSLSTVAADGGLENVTVVVVNAETGEIDEIRREDE